MFKKVKKDNGIREFYLGKKKIFRYVNTAKFAEFVESRFSQAFSKADFNLIYDIGGGQ